MNAVVHIMGLYEAGFTDAELLTAVNQREFHEVRCASDIFATRLTNSFNPRASLEFVPIYRSPITSRLSTSINFRYSPAPFLSFKLFRTKQGLTHFGALLSKFALLDNLRVPDFPASHNRELRSELPAAAVITKTPEILAVISLPIFGSRLSLPKHIFAIFDSHSRPGKHPNGSAFLLFPTSELAAGYLEELLGVDASLLNEPDLRWQAEMLMTYSAHFFVRRDAPYEGDLSRGTDAAGVVQRTMLYESTGQLIQERARIAALEAQISDLKKQNNIMMETQRKADEAHARRIQREQREQAWDNIPSTAMRWGPDRQVISTAEPLRLRSQEGRVPPNTLPSSSQAGHNPPRSSGEDFPPLRRSTPEQGAKGGLGGLGPRPPLDFVPLAVQTQARTIDQMQRTHTTKDTDKGLLARYKSF
jgi:hypothetical protein